MGDSDASETCISLEGNFRVRCEKPIVIACSLSRQDVQGFGSNNIEIGTVGNGNDDGQIRIGNVLLKKDQLCLLGYLGLEGKIPTKGYLHVARYLSYGA